MTDKDGDMMAGAAVAAQENTKKLNDEHSSTSVCTEETVVMFVRRAGQQGEGPLSGVRRVLHEMYRLQCPFVRFPKKLPGNSTTQERVE